MNPDILGIIEHILQVQAVLHDAGTVSAEALLALAEYASNTRIRASVETGCGATTLLLSHLSEHHTVFTLDIGGSVANVRRSPLLRPGVVSFIEGPSQQTLPQHRFDDKLQLAVIDGPHAYPFPDLEYYLIYPHLETGALLVLDDIHIRSIHNLFEFLCSDEMFRLESVVKNTVFFSRTAAPTFDPLGDDWQRQRYNAPTVLRFDWRSKLRRYVPHRLTRAVAAYRHAGAFGGADRVEIVLPRPGDRVAQNGVVNGRARLGEGAFLWVLARRKDVDGWWPQGEGPVGVTDGSWAVPVTYGDPRDGGFDFEVAAVAVTGALHHKWLEWVDEVRRTGLFPPVQLPSSPHVRKAAFRTVHRSAT